MTLQKIAEQLNENVSFPVQSIKKHSNICDGVYIYLSLDPKSEWINGYFENSKGLKAFIFCKDRFERGCFENDTQSYSFSIVSNSTGIALRQKKNATAEQIIKYVSNQLQKLI